MVELSLLHAMTGPSDPLSPQQHNARSNSTPSSNPNHSPWGTWEELLLGSAVLKHGADNWALISAELQSRARASFSFTPEACRAGYHAIKLRFGADGGREGSAALRYEELRRLRVAHLKRELEQYDNSIGSLVNKIKRLQSEREESESLISTELVGVKESCEPTLKYVADVCGIMEKPCGDISTACEVALGMEKPCSDISLACEATLGMEKPCSDISTAYEEAPGNGCVKRIDIDRSSPCCAGVDGVTPVVETPGTALLHANGGEAEASLCNGVEEQVPDEASGSLSHSVMAPTLIPALGDDDKFHAKQEEEQPLTSSNTLQLSISSRDATTSRSMKSDQGVVFLPNNAANPDPVGYVEAEQEMGGRTAEILMRSRDAVDGCGMAPATLMERNNCTVSNEMSNRHCGGPGGVKSARAKHLLPLALQADVSVQLGDTLQGDMSAKQDVSPSLKSVNIEDCKNLARGNAGPYIDDDGGRKSDESESLCSPRLKSSPPIKRRRSYDGSGAGFGREASCAQEAVDDKRMVRKALGVKNFFDVVSNLPVESADSTEGKGQEVLAATKLSGAQDPLAIKVKRETLACKEENGIVPGLGTAKVEGDLLRKPLKPEVRNQSTSSTENSLLHEVWGESAEVVDKEMKPVVKRRRLIGRDRKRNTTTFNTTGLDGGARGGATDLPRQVESSVKTESTANSHGASESMHCLVGKEENDIQVERLSGDSRFEKSEVGSYVDGNEDISPMSRRIRREPKVSGKLIPLLESLRTVCAHRCSPFFRHSQEPEENEMYYCMVRAPIDLGMIRTKLEEGQYSGSMHFFRDLLLMVSNALVYYPRDSAESVAASGLRECVMKEMGNVFETEALVKQEGPSFRKRDSRQLATANQGRRRGGLKLPSTMDKPSRDLALKQSDVSTSVESRRLSHQSLAIGSDEWGVRVDRCVDVKKKNVDSPAEVRISSADNRKTSEGYNGLKVGSTILEKGNEAKVPGAKLLGSKEPSMKLGLTPPPEKPNEVKDLDSSKLTVNVLCKDAKVKDRLFESGGLEKKGEFLKSGSTSKASGSASLKGVESGGGGRKMKAVPDVVVQEPLKRGVGRPPKHSQQQGSQKAREIVEVPNSTRKRARR